MVHLRLSFRYSRTYLRQYLNSIFQSGYERLDRRKTSVSVKISEGGERKGGSCCSTHDRKERIESHNVYIHTIQRRDPLNNLTIFTFRLLLKSRILSYLTPNHAIYLPSCTCRAEFPATLKQLRNRYSSPSAGGYTF